MSSEPEILVARTITVPLAAKRSQELNEIVERSGLSEADIVNRSIGLYAFMRAQERAGARIAVLSADRQHVEPLTFDGTRLP